MMRSLQIVDGFAPEGAALRRVFDERFAEPRSTRGDRFVWDWWHVPGQYTHLRTPAWTYFPRALYAKFHRRLVAWGREVLGCHDISPPWLSCYVDGCRQELHGDLPHGPFAFVYSLTRGRAFRGGQTLMLRDSVLDHWRDFRTRSVEEPQLVRAIPPAFGRLVVFDPRIPHGVREVTGTRDPREGRLVIHGWFVQPRPFVVGYDTRLVQARIAELVGALDVDLPIAGVLSLRYRGGRVTVLSDTTRVPPDRERERKALVRRVVDAVSAWRLPERGSITLPLVFERG